MTYRVKVIQTTEYLLDPSLYPDGLTPEEMVEMDLENGALNAVENWETTYTIKERKSC